MSSASQFPGGGFDQINVGGGGRGGFSDPVGDKLQDIPGPLGDLFGSVGKSFGGIFGGGKDRPRSPYWKRLASREWAQGNAVLTAYNRLYQPTLDLAKRQTKDYGDLYRASANESLAHEITSSTAKRDADLQDYLRLGPELLNARRAADPVFSKSYDLALQSFDDANAPLPSNVRRDITEAVRGSQVSRGMGLGGSDAFEEALQLAMGGEDFRNSRRDRAFAHAGNLFTAYGDPFASLTGRSANPTPQGANVMAPKVGTDWDDLFSYGVNREIQSRNLDAAGKSANKAMIGQIVGGLLGAGGAAAGACWVAREVFGVESIQWRQFREWLLTRAPGRFFWWYLRNGERFAETLKSRPQTKRKLRRWMQGKINELFPVSATN